MSVFLDKIGVNYVWIMAIDVMRGQGNDLAMVTGIYLLIRVALAVAWHVFTAPAPIEVEHGRSW